MRDVRESDSSEIQRILGLAARVESPNPKVFVDELKTGDIVEVATSEARFRLEIIDPEAERIRAFCCHARKKGDLGEYRVLGPIVTGFSLCLEVGSGEAEGIVSSASLNKVERIKVNGEEIE